MAKDPWSLEEDPPPRRRRWRRLVRHVPRLVIGLLVTALVVVVLYPFMVITVPSGYVGVLWKRFAGPGIYCWCILGRGTVLDPVELREEGLHVIWPWDKLYIYDLRLQSKTERYNAISADGVNVVADIAIRFQLAHGSVAVLHKYVGPDYLTSLLAPEIGSEARKIISHYQAQQVYTNRQAIENQIQQGTQEGLGPYLDKLVQPEASEQDAALSFRHSLENSIQVLDTLVLGLELPPDIVDAINRQAEVYYQIQEYKYRVEREAQESKRKQIEADGIAAFQRTVSQGISESYLRWRGIEATLALAQSANAKVVIIGGGKDGLPIILGNVDAPSTAPHSNGGGTPSNGNSPAAPPVAGGPAPPNPPVAAPAPLPPVGKPGTESSGAAAVPEKQASSSLDWSDIGGILSRLSDALLSGGSTTASSPGANAR